MRIHQAFALAVAIASLVSGHKVSSTHGWRKVTKVHPRQMVDLTLAVQQNNLDVVDKLFWDISNPKSENYGKHLTYEQLGDLVRNDKSTTAAIEYLSSNGADQISTAAHGLYIDTVLPAHIAEKVFNAEFNIYYNPSTGAHIIRTESFEIPQGLAEHISHVPNIAHFPVSHKHGVFQAYNVSVDATTSGNVSPQTLFNYYGIANPSVSNLRSTQSLFEALGQDTDNQDLNTFQKQFGVKVNNVAKFIGPNNGSACFSSQGGNNCGEANLDVQYIMAIAQNAPTTYWSIASQDIFLDWIKAVAADANPPLVHSISYGGYEGSGSDALFNTEAKKLGLRGVTVIVSSGDDGVANFQARRGSQNCGYNPSFPATSPFVTAVGATQGPESGKPEVVCSSQTGGVITSGGGFSSEFTTPAYQQNQVKSYFTKLSTQPAPGFNQGGRGMPDVAILGRNYEVVIGGKVYVESGTSASAPVFAGMVTLINDCRLQKGKSALGFLNQALYSLDASTFTDITEGSNHCTVNSVCCKEGFSAAVGWDPITGLGSPHFPRLLNALCNL